MIENQVLKKVTADGKLQFPELRQYFFPWMGFTFWKNDRFFDIQNHIFENTSLLTDQEFPRAVNEAFDEKWPQDRSPWKFLVFPNYRKSEEPGTKTVIVFYAHHGLGDGEGFFQTFFKHIFDEPVNDSIATLPFGMLTQPSSETYPYPFDIISDYFRSSDDNQLHPPGKQLSKRRQVVYHTHRIPLKPIEEVKLRLNVSTTGVILSAIGGGIRRYMELGGLVPPEYLHLLHPTFLPREGDGVTNNR